MHRTLASNLALAAALGLSAMWTAGARAGEIEEQARAILAAHREAVVTVQMVVKQKFSMSGMASQENESKEETTGTVISPEGLTVVALSATDPTSVFNTMMGGADEDFQMASEVTDVRIMLASGEEIPARIVLRDNELDLAYVLPEAKPETALAYVDLADQGAPEVLDQVVTLTRLGKVANRVHAASFERVVAVVEKPRTFYIPATDPTSTSQGSPAFTLDGKLVGIFVIRTIQNTGSESASMFGGNDNVTPIILPARDVQEGASQAPLFDE